MGFFVGKQTIRNGKKKKKTKISPKKKKNFKKILFQNILNKKIKYLLIKKK